VLGRGGRTVPVGADGRVDPRALEVTRLENARKEGGNLVTGTPAGTAGAGEVRAGALEASGSDAARSMVDMIASLRAFEAGQRVIHTIDETLAKAATQVGSVTGG
jgi:flagellar basal-body rod protein FlgF